MKEYLTQLTLRMRKKTRVRFPVGFLIIYYPYFPRNPCFSLNKLELQFFKKRNLCRKILKAKTLLISALNKEHDWQRTATNLEIKKIVDWTFHLNRARPARCSVPALLCCLQKACLLALRITILGLLAGAKPSCVHQDTLSCMKKLFEISRKIRYFMKTHCTAFLGLLPASSSHNTPAGLPKPRVLRCRDASKQSVANAQFDSFSLVWYILAQ